MSKDKENLIERPPVVVVMGHVDHGKSALLDYIRKTNVVEGEAGGITQHISAYEVVHKNKKGEEKKITFLDTPGHSAFSAMRSRGATAADVAILVISSEDGVKPQTLEAYEAIKKSEIPFVVAINKIDKPSSNVQKTISDLIEKEIYVEGYGGDVPFNKISAKTGEGIPELLETILLITELEELKGDTNKQAEGVIVETNVDSKKGISATLLIKNGGIKNGMFVVAEKSIAPTRIMEDFNGKKITEAIFSSPIQIVGFNTPPEIGTRFFTYKNKKEAEQEIEKNNKKEVLCKEAFNNDENKGDDIFILPIAIKADVLGSVEAIESEMKKLLIESVCISVVHKGVGTITENDVKSVGTEGGLVLGFNVKADESAKQCAERIGIEIKTFNIIYELTDWLKEKIEEVRPRKEIKKITGKAKVLKIFNKVQNKQIFGSRILEGFINLNGQITIFRREEEIGKGKIVELQQNKKVVEKISEGGEFGAKIDTKTTISEGDTIESYILTKE